MLSVPLYRSAADVMIMMEAKYCRYGNDDDDAGVGTAWPMLMMVWCRHTCDRIVCCSEGEAKALYMSRGCLHVVAV